jgi:hypothetical protein
VQNDSEVLELLDWHGFYRNHEVYKFVGKLIDPRFYDENGEPTQDMTVLQERIQATRAEQALLAKKRKEDTIKKIPDALNRQSDRIIVQCAENIPMSFQWWAQRSKWHRPFPPTCPVDYPYCRSSNPFLFVF